MPQITKGGKYVFGWSKIRGNGEFRILDEAVQEYNLETGEKIILASGSKTSGGFSIAKKSAIAQSAISSILTENPKLSNFQIAEGQTIQFKSRRYCWVSIHDNGLVVLPPSALEAYGIHSGDCLLSIRSSNIAIGFAVKGPLIEKARKCSKIEIFE
jgi:hypothetical protein